MSKKTHSMVVLSDLYSLFVKISICDPLLLHDLFHDTSECVTLTQGIRTIKTFIKYKMLLLVNLSQVSSVEC